MLFRSVDAFLAGLPDVPAADDPELISVPLSSMPVFFVARADHPLASRPSVSLADIAHYPSLALPEGAYPLVEASLRALGLWNDPVRMHRYQRELWEARAEAELTIGYATTLSMVVSGGDLVRLPLELPFRSGEAIVMRRDLADQPERRALEHCLRQRLLRLAEAHPDLEVLACP